MVVIMGWQHEGIAVPYGRHATYFLYGCVGVRAFWQNLHKVLLPANGEVLSYVFYTSAAEYQVPGTWYQCVFSRRLAPPRHISHITDRSVRTVILVWVGASNKRASCRVRDVIVGFVDR